MNALFAAVFAALATIASAGVLGHGGGVVVSGPSGVVTPHGAIGPAGSGLGLGLGHGAVVAGPALGLGYAGLGLGHGGIGLGGLGLGGLGHGVGYGGLGHGVAVRGPATVPAVIAGPSGKIVADGLYGVPNYGYGHHW